MKAIPPSIKLFLYLFLILPAGSACYAQSTPYLNATSSGDHYLLNIMTTADTRIISWRDPVPGDTSNLYAIWIEKGDGNYVNNFSSGISNITVNSCNMQPIMLATKLYEHKRRPPTTASTAAIAAMATTPGTMFSPELTSGGGQLKLFTNTRAVVDNDYMVAAISYIPKRNPANNDVAAEYQLVFRYNDAVKGAFVPISDTGHKSSMIDNNGRTVPISDIRNFGSGKAEILSTPGRGYTNGIVFKGIAVDPGNTAISNIFISLSTVAADKLPDSSRMEAELFYRTKSSETWVSAGISPVASMPSLSAHDPNSIAVSPRCLPLPQVKHTLHYTINFQNTGRGNADAVFAVFYIPDQMNTSRKIWNLKASYSDIPDHLISTDKITYDWANSRIIFKIDPATDVLDGTEGISNPVNNPKTMGQISFDLEVLPGPNPNQQSIQEAWAEIYFHGVNPSGSVVQPEMVAAGLFLPGTENYERPVRTRNAITLYSACCDGVSKKDCSENVCTWWHCYWWIILVILLIFVLWWLYKRSRRRP